MITRRDLLKASGAALAGLTIRPGAWSGVEAASVDEDLARFVDPFIGTGAHGHTYPGATVPFGTVQLSPDNGVDGWDWSSGYHWSSDRIAGFSHTHLSGTGIGDMYDILFAPIVSAGPAPPDASSAFSHDAERASPGYYAVTLLDHGIEVELTATARVGVHRYTFARIPSGQRAALLVDLGHSLNWDTPTQTAITVDSPTEISGYRWSTGWARDQRVFFAASFSRPIAAHWLQNASAQADRRTRLEGERVKGTFQFRLRPQQSLLAKVAISPVSIGGARRNLRGETPGWEFDEVREAARAAWNRILNRIRIPDASADQKKIFYTALYHACLAPTLFCDVDGAYRGPDGNVHRASDFENHTVFSLWDTFRAEHPLLTLLLPERLDDLIRSMIAFYREGGLLPVWSLAGVETNTMIGYHSVPVILDAWAKGLTSIDPHEALEAMKRSAMQDAHGLRFYRMPEPTTLPQAREEDSKENLPRIGRIRASDLQQFGALVSGYDRTIAGETLGYHSPDPKARSALLIRSEDGRKSIVWETAVAPTTAATDKFSFVWMAGIDAGAGQRRFTLKIDGDLWFVFRGPAAGSDGFELDGPQGSRLSFVATHTDRYEDLFGYMFLTLPGGVLKPGQRLQLQVTAEAAGTRDWYMTFERRLEHGVEAENVFGLVEEAGERRQLVRAHIMHVAPPADAVVRVGNLEPVLARLEFGSNALLLPAPTVERETPAQVRVAGEGPAREAELRLRPVRPYGYLPADWERESVSKTLEYAYDDWCIARLAERLGATDDARLFAERARFYRNVFDPASGFMRGRLSDGTWKTPFSPKAASHRQDEYTEGNAWQYSWFVPHDVRGLIELMGGRQAFIAKLDQLFEETSELEGAAPPDISGLIGQYAHGNEPSHHVAYLYAYAGAPWKTQERVRQITSTLYGTSPEGLPGNEDCGQMSAWYILSALGFYPVNPADGTYVIGAPHFESAVIELEAGKKFTVRAPGVSEVNKYIQSVTLNGRPLDRCYITHADIVAGGELVFEMGDRPNTTWASDPSAAPPSMSDG